LNRQPLPYCRFLRAIREHSLSLVGSSCRRSSISIVFTAGECSRDLRSPKQELSNGLTVEPLVFADLDVRQAFSAGRSA
jgi:hypothetical protein